MTQEEKSILLKDLCARLPYHVRCKIWFKYGTTQEVLLDLKYNYGDVLQDAFYFNKIKDIKPYLRPMSSMTEEEEKEYQAFFNYDGVEYPEEYIDWLNSHHFDYRGLIEKGLALEAPNGMYNIKEK